MLIYSFITDYQAFNLRYKDNTTRDKNETKVGKQSANLGKNNEPIQNRLSFLIDCKSVILHHLTILSFPMVRPAWDNWWLLEHYPKCRVFVCTPIQTGDVTRNERNLEKIAILREICRALSVQLIDCYSNSGITEKFEQPSGRGRYLRDGLHPDKEGQELMGRYIAKEIRNNFF